MRRRNRFLPMKTLSLYYNNPFSPTNPHFHFHIPFSHLLLISSPLQIKTINKEMACLVHSSRRTDNPLSCDPKKTQFSDNSNLYPYSSLCRPIFPDFDIHVPGNDNDLLWSRMRDEATLVALQEPVLTDYYTASILSHASMESALSGQLSVKLSDHNLPRGTLEELFTGVLTQDREIVSAVACDLRAVKERDPACISYAHCFLNFKGFLACQAHRIAHKLWSQGRKTLALIIQSRVSEVFAVDIHPGARIGRGILLDHATGVVIGETAIIGDDVAILHNVTLGGTGKKKGDRHPKIGNGVLIGAGTCVLGNVVIGEGAKIGAGSVVLKAVPPRTTAVGNPARLIGKLDKIPSLTMDHTSDICEWSDYVI